MSARKPKSTASGTLLGDIWTLRAPERHLLLLSALAIALGFAMVLGSGYADGQAPSLMSAWPLLLYCASLAIMHLTLVTVRFRGDQLLLATLAFLAGLGLLVQYRMGALDLGHLKSPDLYLLPTGIGIMLALCVALMRGRYEILSRGLWLWAGLSLALVALLLVLGQRYRGGVYGAGLMTPTELLKVSVVLFLASFIDRHTKPLSDWGRGVPRPPVRTLLPLAVFWLLLAGLLLWQRDLGMFVILSLTLLFMLYVGTGRIGYLLLGGGLAGLVGYLVLGLFEHGQRRVQAWLSPFEDPTGSSWQILQGLSGMYSGGLWGEGFGEGHPEYTPIAQSDFVYAVIGEELGFIGCTLLVILLFLFFARGLGIADQTRSSFGRLLCAGLTAVLATQTFLNLGGVTKLIPLTGITLPFISHGGSSLITGLVSLGLMLAISDGADGGQGRRPAGKGKTKGAASGTSKKSRERKSRESTGTRGRAKEETDAGDEDLRERRAGWAARP